MSIKAQRVDAALAREAEAEEAARIEFERKAARRQRWRWWITLLVIVAIWGGAFVLWVLGTSSGPAP